MIGVGHCITLGHLADALSSYPSDAIVRWDRERKHYYGRVGKYPGYFHSWRGDYSDLTLDRGMEPPTVAQLLTRAQAAIGATFQGWKGCDFRMDRETPVWAENDGDCQEIALVGVRRGRSGEVVLVTKKVAV